MNFGAKIEQGERAPNFAPNFNPKITQTMNFSNLILEGKYKGDWRENHKDKSDIKSQSNTHQISGKTNSRQATSPEEV